MGVHNKHRRAAKASRRRARRGPGPSGRTRWPWDAPFRIDPLELAASWVSISVSRLASGPLTAANGRAQALALRARTAGLPTATLSVAIYDLADRLLAPVAASWSPEDLAELVRRKAGDQHVPALAGLLRRSSATAAVGGDGLWHAELDRLGPGRALELAGEEGVTEALLLAALLVLAPAGAAPAAPGTRPVRPAACPADARRLATVRALLAKAESTPYDEEAETLTAKAQELVARYALERLLASDVAGGVGGSRGVVSRRLWIDPPYPAAKAQLIHEVAVPNRCRAVYSESLSLCTVVGDPADLDAVELLVTSLLVQADRAMVRHGSHVDRRGVSRTRSFRRSFLTSFAVQIGQRLSEVTQAQVDATRRPDLLPVLHSHAERVDAECDRIFPAVVERDTIVSNAHGWAAGRVAADLAALDAYQGLEEAPPRTLW